MSIYRPDTSPNGAERRQQYLASRGVPVSPQRYLATITNSPRSSTARMVAQKFSTSLKSVPVTQHLELSKMQFHFSSKDIMSQGGDSSSATNSPLSRSESVRSKSSDGSTVSKHSERLAKLAAREASGRTTPVGEDKAPSDTSGKQALIEIPNEELRTISYQQAVSPNQIKEIEQVESRKRTSSYMQAVTTLSCGSSIASGVSTSGVSTLRFGSRNRTSSYMDALNTSSRGSSIVSRTSTSGVSTLRSSSVDEESLDSRTVSGDGSTTKKANPVVQGKTPSVSQIDAGEQNESSIVNPSAAIKTSSLWGRLVSLFSRKAKTPEQQATARQVKEVLDFISRIERVDSVLVAAKKLANAKKYRETKNQFVNGLDKLRGAMYCEDQLSISFDGKRRSLFNFICIVSPQLLKERPADLADAIKTFKCACNAVVVRKLQDNQDFIPYVSPQLLKKQPAKLLQAIIETFEHESCRAVCQNGDNNLYELLGQLLLAQLLVD